MTSPETKKLAERIAKILESAPALDDAAIRKLIGDLPSTPLETGMRETMDRFAALRDEGVLDTTDLDT